MRARDNTFARNGSIEIAPNEIVRWSHIVALNDLQKVEGLNAANKLSDRHIHYSQQVMKVSRVNGMHKLSLRTKYIQSIPICEYCIMLQYLLNAPLLTKFKFNYIWIYMVRFYDLLIKISKPGG